MPAPAETPPPRHWSWAMYDWANSAYATTVMVVFFPLFYKSFWRADAAADLTTANIGFINGAASLVVAVAAPFLGAIADNGGAKKRFLLAFTVLGVAATGSLGLVGEGQWHLALAAFGLSLVGFSGGLIFYDALLMGVAPRARWDFVSALGYSLGYIGGGLQFLGCVILALKPEFFGLDGTASATRVAFLATAVWWMVFSLPLFLRVPEPRLREPLPPGAAILAGLRQFAQTFAHIRRLRPVLLFLLAYWLYNDGVGTVMRMATAYGADLDLPQQDLIFAILLVQFVGFPAAIAFGKLGERAGAKRGILVAISVYMMAVVYATTMREAIDFYVLAVAIGLVQGGVQSLSRSFYARLIPPDKSGEFFGFYNMLGKFAAVAGPQLMAVTALALGPDLARYSILSLLLLFGAGGMILLAVPEQRHSAS